MLVKEFSIMVDFCFVVSDLKVGKFFINKIVFGLLGWISGIYYFEVDFENESGYMLILVGVFSLFVL